VPTKTAAVIAITLAFLMSTAATVPAEPVFRLKNGIIEKASDDPGTADPDQDGDDNGSNDDDNVGGDGDDDDPYSPDPYGDPGFLVDVENTVTYDEESVGAPQPLKFRHKSTSEHKVCFEATGGYGNYTFFTNIMASAPWPTTANPNFAKWLGDIDVVPGDYTGSTTFQLMVPASLEGNTSLYGEDAEATTADGNVCFRYSGNASFALTNWEFEIYVEDWVHPDSAFGESEGEYIEPAGAKTLRVRFNVVED